MGRLLATVVAGSLALLAAPLVTSAASQAPTAATAQCKDGTYSTAKTQRGAQHPTLVKVLGTMAIAKLAQQLSTRAPQATR